MNPVSAENLINMSEWAKQLDETRLIHYEGETRAIMTKSDNEPQELNVAADMFSTMYSSVELLDKWGKRTDLEQPHILCEFGHAMGNGPGGFKEYFEMFYKYERLQGGFVWEWIDHGIRTETPDGKNTSPMAVTLETNRMTLTLLLTEWSCLTGHHLQHCLNTRK